MPAFQRSNVAIQSCDVHVEHIVIHSKRAVLGQTNGMSITPFYRLPAAGQLLIGFLLGSSYQVAELQNKLLLAGKAGWA